MHDMNAHCTDFVRTLTSLESARSTYCVDADDEAESVGSSISSDDDEPVLEGSDSNRCVICDLYHIPR